MQRDGATAELADRMITAQATREKRLAIADEVVCNHGVLKQLSQAARRLDADYRARANP